MTGSELKALREAAGITQQELGERIGYTGRSAVTMISRWENESIDSKTGKKRKITKPMAMLLKEKLKKG